LCPIQGVLQALRIIFPFKFVRGRFFFSFFPPSQCVPHYVPFKFPMGSRQVLNVFPNIFSIAPCSLLSHMVWRMLSSFHLYSWAKGEELCTSKYNFLGWGTWVVSILFEWWANQICLVAKKIKIWTWDSTSPTLKYS